jgi:type I restriction enzyme M protein
MVSCLTSGREYETLIMRLSIARMNVILHDCATADIQKDNTLSSPQFKERDGRLKTFDFVVANFPFSAKSWSNGFDPANDLYGRFAFGIPPKKNGDFAFLLHILACLKSTGKGAVIHPHGVLFRGGAEAVIRREIVKRGYIKGIIGLPANLFYGTTISACILVIDKEDAQARRGIFMIDASKGFIRDGNKNRLREQDIHRIVDTFTRQLEVPRYSRMVPLSEISDPENDFILNLPRYIDSTEPEDLQDIDGHMRGGIPKGDIDALGHYWQVFPSLPTLLFESAGRPGYSRLKLPMGDIKRTILGHPEFATFTASITALFEQWKSVNAPRLIAIKPGDRPKALVETLSEDLLASFGRARLIDSYNVYQYLMDYWAAKMQDDVYIISASGWVEGGRVRQLIPRKNKDGKTVWSETHDFKIAKQRFRSDLIPASLLVARYFGAEQTAVEALKDELGTLDQQLDYLKDEHGNEGGLLEDVIEGEGDKQKIVAKSVRSQLKQFGSDPDYAAERKLLEMCSALLDRQVDAKTRLKAAEKALEAKVAKKYRELTDAEIKTLVVYDKWLVQLAADVRSELDRVSQALTSRIRQVAERYATPLPQITTEVETFAARVDEHLKRMGI